MIILTEDAKQQGPARRHLERCGHNAGKNCRLAPLPNGATGGSRPGLKLEQILHFHRR